MLKLLVSNIQNLQNTKFNSCQIKLVYSISEVSMVTIYFVMDTDQQEKKYANFWKTIS